MDCGRPKRERYSRPEASRHAAEPCWTAPRAAGSISLATSSTSATSPSRSSIPSWARCSYDTARQESADDLVDLEPPGGRRPVLLKLREAGHQPMDCGFQVRGASRPPLGA